VPGFFPVLLAAHVLLAVLLLVPSLLLPFALRGRDAGAESRRAPTRALLRLQGQGTVLLGLAVAATGLGLLALLGPQLAAQPWLALALALYAANLLAAFFLQRPGLRGLLGLPGGASEAERARWRLAARRQRYLSYLMAAGIAAIAFLMSTKPAFW
jgi:Predicted integral membrane protein (DUF2269)